MAVSSGKKARMTWNKTFFDKIMRQEGIERIEKETAEKICQIAKSTAPVDTGEYRDSLHVSKRASGYRDTYTVSSDAPHALIIESKTGNLARAVKAARKK